MAHRLQARNVTLLQPSEFTDSWREFPGKSTFAGIFHELPRSDSSYFFCPSLMPQTPFCELLLGRFSLFDNSTIAGVTATSVKVPLN